MAALEDSFRFRQMLVKLGDLFKPGDLDKLKFVCKEAIPGRVREDISSSEVLFLTLEERGKLSQSDLTFLRGILQNALIGRTDVLRILDEYQQGQPISTDGEYKPPSPEILKVFCFVEEKLGKEFKSFLRYLEVDDRHIDNSDHKHRGVVKEVIHECLYLWLQDNRQLTDEQLFRKVVGALKRVNRNDLVIKLQKEFPNCK